MNGFITVGDKVMWQGSWGNDSPKIAEVSSIMVCDEEGENGYVVDNLEWDMVRERDVVITLSNSHWAWGFQIKPLLEVVK